MCKVEIILNVLLETRVEYLIKVIKVQKKKKLFIAKDRSRKTVRFLEQIMSADKYPCIFSRQMEAIVFIILQIFFYKATFWKTFSQSF